MILIVPMQTTMFLQGREGTVVFEIRTNFSFNENNLFDCYIQIFQQNSKYQASESSTRWKLESRHREESYKVIKKQRHWTQNTDTTAMLTLVSSYSKIRSNLLLCSPDFLLVARCLLQVTRCKDFSTFFTEKSEQQIIEKVVNQWDLGQSNRNLQQKEH